MPRAATTGSWMYTTVEFKNAKQCSQSVYKVSQCPSASDFKQDSIGHNSKAAQSRYQGRLMRPSQQLQASHVSSSIHCRLRTRVVSHATKDRLIKLLKSNRKWSKERIESDPEYFNRLSNQQAPEFLWIGENYCRRPILLNICSSICPPTYRLQ